MIEFANGVLLVVPASRHTLVVIHVGECGSLCIWRRKDTGYISRYCAEAISRDNVSRENRPDDRSVRLWNAIKRIGDRDQCSSRREGLREIAGNLERGRDGEQRRRALADDIFFEVPEEECLVSLYRSADRAAKLILVETGTWIAGSVLEEAIRVQVAVAPVFVRRSMN